jgi:hypothetical protein
MAQLRAAKAGTTVAAQGSGWAGVTQRAWGLYEHAVSPAAADTVVMCKLPKGALIVGGAVKGDKLDSSGSGSSLASINIGLDAAVTTPDGTSVSTASTSNCLLAALNLGPDAAAVTGYKPEAGVRNVPLGGLLLTHGPLRTSAECHAYVTWTASALAFATGTMLLEIDYIVDQHS